MKKDEKLEPLPSDDFPKEPLQAQDLTVNMSDQTEFSFANHTTPLPFVPEDTPPTGFPNLDLDVPLDFSFGGSAEEAEEALKRNEELASKGFSLSNTEDENLRPKLYDEEGSQLNTLASSVDLGDKAPTASLDVKGWSDYDTIPSTSKLPTGIVPRGDEHNHWKRLYFAQKGITAQLEKIIEEMV